MIPRKELKAIRHTLKAHRGAMSILARELGVALPSVSLWLMHGYGLSADKELHIQQRVAELPEWYEKSKPKPKGWNPKPNSQNSVWRILREAVRRGIVVKPNTCESCGALPTGRGPGKALHAHHEDYSKPLDVKWLCSACHKRLHVKRDTSPRGVAGRAKNRANKASALAFQQYIESRATTDRMTETGQISSPVSPNCD